MRTTIASASEIYLPFTGSAGAQRLDVVEVPATTGPAATRRRTTARSRWLTALSGLGLRTRLLAGSTAGTAFAAAAVLTGVEVPPGTVVGFAALIFVVLTASRGLSRLWGRRRRRSSGGRADAVVVIGDALEVGVAIDLFREHPELGYRVTDVVTYTGVSTDAGGNQDEAVRAAEEADAVVIVVPGLPAAAVNSLVGRLHTLGVITYLHTGVTRTGPARVRTVALPHQVLHQVVAPSHSALQGQAKRVIDIAVGGVLLVVTAPILAVAAIAVALDGGPVLYRQERVGVGGRTFVLLKLRTMVVGADGLLIDLRDRNERDGPLFKLDADPRVTRVGRILRAWSLDELPQLVNVLRGEMSLVGPRPALLEETLAFDPELRRRTDLRPGLTGLWQVVARDKPSQYLYRELDLFYVDNWTVTGDLVILGRTAGAVLGHARRRPEART